MVRLRRREPVPQPLGAPVRPDAVNELLRACSQRAGLAVAVAPHQLRHAFASNVADAGGCLDEIAELLGHRSMASSQVYLHPTQPGSAELSRPCPRPAPKSGPADEHLAASAR